jgi:hypothetical protein
MLSAKTKMLKNVNFLYNVIVSQHFTIFALRRNGHYYLCLCTLCRGFFYEMHFCASALSPYKKSVVGLLFFVKLVSCTPLSIPTFEYTLNHFQFGHTLSKNSQNFFKLFTRYFKQYAEPSGLFPIFTITRYLFDIISLFLPHHSSKKILIL